MKFSLVYAIMSTENVQVAIRRNIELAFVKKAKIEFKGDRSEARILVSTIPLIEFCCVRLVISKILFVIC